MGINPKGNRVVVAMSGGVDSSVAAALLKQQGYDVIGITMQVWPDVSEEEAYRSGGCCSLAAVEDARRVAGMLGIPHYVLNLKEIFEERVIANFCHEYIIGRTPNPCLICNRDIKFGALLARAMEIDASYVATGHYARIARSPDGRFLLLRGVDREKDQSYALYMLTQDQLSRAMFPLGNMKKAEVRRMAREIGLPVAEKAESQEICFVTSGSYADFIRRRYPGRFKPGPIIDCTTGRIVGIHRGLPEYTIGQRRGLRVEAGKPMYVIDIDAKGNTVMVGPKEKTFSSGLIASSVNFIPFEELGEPMRVTCKVRYRAEEAGGIIERYTSSGRQKMVKLTFDEPQRAIAPGQSAVFYDGEVVVGGGIIESRFTYPGRQRS